MGNSKTNSPSSNTSYEDQNNKNAQLILDIGSFSQSVKNKVKLLLDFCNENNLQILDSISELINAGRDYIIGRLKGGWEPLLRIKDPETGVEYTFNYIVMNDFEDNFPHFTRENVVQNFKDALNELRVMKKVTDPEFTENLKRINFEADRNCYGSFNDFSDPFGINISALAFGKKGTGLQGTMVHEVAHLWEHNHVGYTGALKQFAERDSYPCGYASRQYSDGTRPECLATTVEQVYTHKLRDDALMKNGVSVKTQFQRRYGRSPKSKADMDEMYRLWYSDWYDDLGHDTEIILGI